MGIVPYAERGEMVEKILRFAQNDRKVISEMQMIYMDVVKLLGK